jgi:hypothetical protein
MNGWLKVKRVAEYCDVSERTLSYWLKEGLPHANDKFKVTETRFGGIVNEVVNEL